MLVFVEVKQGSEAALVEEGVSGRSREDLELLMIVVSMGSGWNRLGGGGVVAILYDGCIGSGLLIRQAILSSGLSRNSVTASNRGTRA